MNIGSDRATAFAVISSFEALRAYVPAQAGVRVTLNSWKDGGIYGGGDFVSVAGVKPMMAATLRKRPDFIGKELPARLIFMITG